jgi:hypothetical protein
MNTDTKRSNTPTLPKYLAAAGITLLLMAPLTASADHDRHDVVEVLAGAAVAYLIIDALDDDSRYYRRHSDHYAYDRHYKQNHHDRHYNGRHHVKHKRHHPKHKWHHAKHKRHGYENRSYRRNYR